MEIKNIRRPWIEDSKHRHNIRNDRGFDYQSKAWRNTRNAFIKDHPYCSCGCGQKADMVDHKVRIKDGGDPYNWSNLQSMAKSCHNKKDNNARTR